MTVSKYKKIELSIKEFISDKSIELKDIPTYYYNKNNIHAVLEYLNLEQKYIVYNNELYELIETNNTDKHIVYHTEYIEIIK